MVITGDPSQVDLPFGAKSGLRDAMEILPVVKGVSVINFTEKDVVRHDMVTRIVKAYNKRDRKLTDFKENKKSEDNQNSDT
jgi:phosphate starvation-inducible PhoH-like protein